MKNRYIPFGYQIQNGDSVINTEQAATVQHIFYAYTEGQSFKEIAEYLTTSGTAYHFSDNSWNKNIVARILANEIYCGAKGYPAIISKEVYSQAASIHGRKQIVWRCVNRLEYGTKFCSHSPSIPEEELHSLIHKRPHWQVENAC